jgi:DNA-3-methyladenine glycosylase I
MNKTRCDWAGNNPLYVDYHDNEWGYPVKDDDKLFEFLILETFQAGLSWITILKKRENFREAFDQFDFKNIAQYDELKVNELLQNSGIVRNQLKIRAAISNAKAFMEVQREFGSFSSYLWAFVNHKPIINLFKKMEDVPATSSISGIVISCHPMLSWRFKGNLAASVAIFGLL